MCTCDIQGALVSNGVRVYIGHFYSTRVLGHQRTYPGTTWQSEEEHSLHIVRSGLKTSGDTTVVQPNAPVVRDVNYWLVQRLVYKFYAFPFGIRRAYKAVEFNHLTNGSNDIWRIHHHVLYKLCSIVLYMGKCTPIYLQRHDEYKCLLYIRDTCNCKSCSLCVRTET